MSQWKYLLVPSTDVMVLVLLPDWVVCVSPQSVLIPIYCRDGG